MVLMGFSTPLAQYSLRRDSKGLFVPNCLHAGVFFRRVLSISLVAAEQRAEGGKRRYVPPSPCPVWHDSCHNLSKSYLMHPWNPPSLKKTYASIAPQGTSRKRKNRSKATFRCNLQPNYILLAISRNNCKA